ncbi:MAG: homocysteine S-methyltransferase family protein [Clostridia bacterium]|nr:homocysteine S-methyltransferase family protein [Clostridia bacterium]
MTEKEAFLQEIRTRRFYFDGGAGSLLLARGLAPGAAPESWNLERPDAICAIHREYIAAGAEIITTNTFGVNPQKYPDFRPLVSAALQIAKTATEGTNAKIAFDVGPLGRLLSPLGDLPFEDAVSIFRELIGYAASLQIADLIIIETMNDAYETKAAVLGAKEACELPIFVTNAYDATNKLMTGATPAAMVALLEGLGVDALGVNCSLGPDLMLPIVDELLTYASVPVIVSPNAGLPAVVDGKTIYPLGAEAFADKMAQIASAGAAILGGCCGTTPEYIKKTVERTKNIPLIPPAEKSCTTVSSYTHAVVYGGAPVVIGERINPTGKPKLKAALQTKDTAYIVAEAVREEEAGADILDVNAGLPGIDEADALCRAVFEIQKVTDLPLSIDSSDPAALEAAMRIYNGKPLVNSVSGKAESMRAVFPLIKKYGGAVIALTLDENGIPQTAKARLAIAENIIRTAGTYGIRKSDIIIDPLAMTVSSDQNAPPVALQTLKYLAARGIRTVMGVSNVSFGLPRRDVVNAAFLLSALEAGLTGAILNPFDPRMTEALLTYRLLHALDPGCAAYLKYAAETTESPAPQTSAGVSLFDAVLRGMKDAAATAAADEKYKSAPLAAINGEIVGALSEIGKRFEGGAAYLPQILMSAEAAQEAVGVLRQFIPSTAEKKADGVILATVKGDIHDIGKNIVKVLLESYGFSVFDLGRDVEPRRILEAVNSTGCRLVGLSALMTTTVPAMEETIRLLHAADPGIKICVGGAVLNAEYAENIGADQYCKDAMDTVKYAQSFYRS